MQTKTEILQACKIEGTVIKLPSVQLERKLYLEVAKALELIGGKWKGGKVAGFEYPSDPSEHLAGLISALTDPDQPMPAKNNPKKQFQFFETPDDVADWLVSLADIKPSHYICEPSAGQGAIVKAIRSNCPGLKQKVAIFELMPLNKSILKSKVPGIVDYGDDFLQYDKRSVFDRIIANPPFSKNQDIDHVRQMYDCLKPGGRMVSVMSKHWTFASNRKETQFREWIKEVKAETHTIPSGAFKQSGTMIESMVVVINKPIREIRQNSSNSHQQEPQKQQKQQEPQKQIMSKVQNEAIALGHLISPTDVYNQSLLYFIHGGKIHPDALNELFGKRGKSIESERKARFTWCSKTDGKTINQIAHQLWQENLDLDSDTNPETSDWRDAIEEIIIQYSSPVQMAKDLVRKLNPQAQIPEEEPQQPQEQQEPVRAIRKNSCNSHSQEPKKQQKPISPVSALPAPCSLQLVKYSDRAVALIGDTKQIKDKLKELWGSYNPNLRINGQTVKGWVFSAKREPQLRQLIAS